MAARKKVVAQTQRRKPKLALAGKNHVIETEERRLAELASPEQVIAEARRVVIFPRWVHIAALVETYSKFQKANGEHYTWKEFYDAVSPVEFSINSIGRWSTAYGIWKELPPASRRKTGKVSYYLGVWNHPKFRSGEWTLQHTFEHVLNTSARLANAKIYLGSLQALAALLKKGEVLRELADMLSPEQLAKVRQAAQEVLSALGKLPRGRRKKAA